ncbi:MULTISPECIES: acyl-CoA dehydrogenase family protein [Cryobacterium]|uniref:Acyl-CoA dehydrogenase n=1 Tax=Cryobacterium breve TaxID=1259258 RepID=A0ABY2ITY1_9MICO|nr:MULTISPECIES: acyl-CoA dehydrogenase family protein [Cryobacterium]TFC94806.1 acyl-CoA dehydrogenase [Cryobacterium breve]TFC94936.1 acyl-CoA dehydrogenase [Cryobacterium sp. TmT3-12]
MSREPVWLTAPGKRPADCGLQDTAAAAFAVNGDAGRALDLSRSLGGSVPRPGNGQTVRLFETLATLAAVDLTAARVAEAHLDALSILDQADLDPAGVVVGGSTEPTWGVFAAEGAGVRLDARQTGHERWHLDGTKPWCSLAGSLSHALITAHTSATTRRLFMVALTDPGITVRTDLWVSRGLPDVPSGPVEFRDVSARPVGSDGWYLRRPGFAWGGIGVAACWWGGAVGLARRVWESVLERKPDQIALSHLGALDVALTAAGTSLAAAATAIDAGDAVGEQGALLAARVRGQIARTVEDVVARTGHALGPAPLAFDPRHAARVADLQLYVRQHHAERDDVALGSRLRESGVSPW